jgi:outer membrane lipoprotein-sorting protein
MKTNTMLATAVALFFAAGAQAQTVDEIVDKHIAAMGGMDKLNAINTVTMEQSISVQGMEIPIKTTVVRGKAFRTESSVMGNSMITVVSGGTGWKVVPAMMQGTGEPEDLTAAEVGQQGRQTDPFGALVGYKDKGYTVELVGKEQLDKKDVFHLKFTDKAGGTFDEWIDANTYLVKKLKAEANGQTGEFDFTEYQDVQGVKFPKSMEMSTPMGMMTMNTDKVTVNVPVDEAIFKKPAK